MRKRWRIAGLIVGLAVWPAGLFASGDVGCYTQWKLTAPTLDCANRIVIGPGNDTRVNLMLLLRGEAGLSAAGEAYAAPDWQGEYGHTFFDWDQLTASLYPSEAPGEEYAEPPDFYATRCQSVRTGGEQFMAAADRNRLIGERDRAALAEGREALVRLCQASSGYRSLDDTSEPEAPTLDSLELPHSFASAEAREFGTYLTGAAAFYLGDWRTARERFAALRGAKDEWVRETALYMAARTDINAATAAGMDEWGYFDPAKADQAAGERAGRALEAYLATYPRGRFAASAGGLVRRAHWLGGALDKQGAIYARMVAATDPKAPETARLLNEIDDKFLLKDGAGEAIEGPWLLAVHDLLRMRDDGDDAGDWERHELPKLTARELAVQESAFAGEPGLFDFLRANHAFYVERDYGAVLRLLPDAAGRPAFTPLQFSRQALRGMALAELDDRNAAGFWQELMGGATDLYQRSTAELGLALNWERNGEVAKVFAPGSPIEDRYIRQILLQHAAGPAVLRRAAKAASRPQDERDTAAFVLLYKELSRGDYAAALSDFALARPDASTEGWVGDLLVYEHVPLGLFTQGKFAEDYACPALRETVARLARDAGDVKGRLCLGEFYRLNGFDYITIDGARDDGELGSFASYPGRPVWRSRFYADIIAEPGVSREDRAYALYRAIYCYAPTGGNGCGGDEVEESQRRAWFRRLKGEFADTRWGKEIEYYW